MKRFFIYAVLVLIPASIQAEDLQFVTTLSSPLGTFSQLETADPTTAVVSPVVNFCNTRTSTGRIELRGANAYLQNLTLKNGTTLGGDVQEYRLSSSLNVNNGGNVKGKRLLANNMSLSGAGSMSSQVNNTLYVSSMGVKGAKTGSLTIPSKVQTSNTGNNDEMEWSNIYSRDYTSDGSATGSSYSSYLLKSVAGEEAFDCSKGPQGNSKYRTCSCGGKIYSYWNVSQCKYIEDDYVDATVSCMTYYCSSDDGNHLQSSGCWLEDILSFDVDLYTYARGRGSWKKTDLRHTQSTSIKWTDSCGWPDGLYLDNSSCETKFGLTSSGASSKTVTCGDCTYKISLETDSSEEEWNSSYCMGLNF